MKEFTYDKNGLDYDACFCLEESGLRETRWILDATWFIKNQTMTYNEWIGE